MALPQIVSRNIIQKNPRITLNAREVGATLIFYTCPTGKKAFIEGTTIMTGLGAAANVRLEANAVPIVLWTATTTDNTLPITFECQLDAGETLAKAQDSGTNGEVNVSVSILETPA